MAALPPAETIVQSVRESCAACTARSGITIDEAAIERFLLGIADADWKPSDHGVRLPLRFDSIDDELNVLATLALLNFLSGYRTALHRLTGRGAYSTILSLVLSAYLSDSSPSLLSAAGMAAATVPQLADLARIRTHVEKDHPTLGSAVRVGEKDEEAFEVLELLVGVLRETGAVLQREGAASLGVWLAATFPAFRDVHEVDSETVYLLKKALWLTTVISLRFSAESGLPFRVPAVAELPVFADNVLPTLLIHHDILSLSSSSDSALASLSLASPAALSRDSATRLRAAAVTACAALVSRAHALAASDPSRAWMAGWTEQQLDGWLWELGKREDLRAVERVAERGTVFY
ncbi:hypothetical protein Rhopal_003466-T1 [Rhodotorula paludigena]|uniref:Queuosine 5'-phosphate N-glycosylase/hydrolase n=1 Tax=Rhodotorula paludigena TaxID=86838 RepID=A0AAV5GD29_9BASI|nr:hypothetical protein Rhopal_003466-T1 [Rhodotorula paludigena]